MGELTPAARQLVEQLRDQVVPAVLTPMSPHGQLDMGALEAYARTISECGAGGLAVWAHTGRGPYLSADRRSDVLSVFRATTRLPLVVGVGATPGPTLRADQVLTEALRVGADAVEQGADGLLVFPVGPTVAETGREQLTLELHARLADELDVPLVLFQLHAEAGGFAYSSTLVGELLAMPHTAGIKLATLDSAMTCQDLTALVRESYPDRLAITGEDRMFGPSLMWGASSSLVGIAAAVPELTLDVAQTWRNGKADAFLAASARLDRFAAVTFRAPMEGYVQRMMWAAEWEGSIPAESAHDAFGPRLPPSERTKVFDCLDGLVAGAGFEPA